MGDPDSHTAPNPLVKEDPQPERGRPRPERAQPRGVSARALARPLAATLLLVLLVAAASQAPALGKGGARAHARASVKKTSDLVIRSAKARLEDGTLTASALILNAGSAA